MRKPVTFKTAGIVFLLIGIAMGLGTIGSWREYRRTDSAQIRFRGGKNGLTLFGEDARDKVLGDAAIAVVCVALGISLLKKRRLD